MEWSTADHAVHTPHLGTYSTVISLTVRMHVVLGADDVAAMNLEYASLWSQKSRRSGSAS
jgi:hypothetical protein